MKNALETIWVDRNGTQTSTRRVVQLINLATGGAYTAITILDAHPVGSIYANGELWFQRIA